MSVGHENGMPWITIVRKQNTITERIDTGLMRLPLTRGEFSLDLDVSQKCVSLGLGEGLEQYL